IGSACWKRMSARTAQADFVVKPRWTMALPRGIIARDHNLLLPGDTLAMTRCTRWLRSLLSFACLLCTLGDDVGRLLLPCRRPSPAPAAENLYLRKQLALYQEWHVKPKRATNTDRLILVWRSRWFDWRTALAVVQPQTFIRWHRQGCRLFWHWKS